MQKFLTALTAAILALASPAVFAQDLTARHHLELQGLGAYERLGAAITSYFFADLPEVRTAPGHVLSFAHAWQNYVINRLPGQIGTADTILPRETATGEIVFRTWLFARVAKSARRSTLSLDDRVVLANTAIGFIHVITGLEDQFGEPQSEARAAFKRAAVFDIGLTASTTGNVSDSEIIQRFLYLAFDNYPIDMIEQVSSAIFGMQRGSAEYKHDLTRTFLRFVLPKATQPTVFLNSKARLQYWMAAEALTEFKDDFSSSKEELLSIQLSAARELQSSQLVRRTQLSIIENQLSKSPKLIDAFRLRTAAALTAYEIEIYLFAISFILIIAASARASMSLYEQRLDPLAKAGDLTWPKIIFKSVWNSPQILTGKVALAVFSFAAGMWLTKAETVTSLFN